MKKVSVAMITYNHEKYIEEAISSVMNQKGKFDIELVIGNDCSKDNTSGLKYSICSCIFLFSFAK